MVDFGNKLKQLRTDNGYSQSELAKRISITKSMVSAYENSMRLPSYDVLINIANCFHVTSDYLLGLSSDKTLDISNLSVRQVEVISRLIEEFNTEKK